MGEKEEWERSKERELLLSFLEWSFFGGSKCWQQHIWPRKRDKSGIFSLSSCLHAVNRAKNLIWTQEDLRSHCSEKDLQSYSSFLFPRACVCACVPFFSMAYSSERLCVCVWVGARVCRKWGCRDGAFGRRGGRGRQGGRSPLCHPRPRAHLCCMRTANEWNGKSHCRKLSLSKSSDRRGDWKAMSRSKIALGTQGCSMLPSKAPQSTLQSCSCSSALPEKSSAVFHHGNPIPSSVYSLQINAWIITDHHNRDKSNFPPHCQRSIAEEKHFWRSTSVEDS